MGTRLPARRRSLPRMTGVDATIAALLAGSALLLHPVGPLVHRPFWVDEAWVANLATLRFSREVALSSSTPIGWVLLLRLVPGHAAQRFRVVPLLFSCAIPLLAYLFVRDLNWRDAREGRAAGVLAGAATLLTPMSLVRNDLKQYSADAALSLLVLLVARNADQRDGRRPLVRLALTSVAVVPFSSVAQFVVVAAFVGLVASAALERRWHRARLALVAGAATGIVMAAYDAAFILPHDNASLRDYWRGLYLSGSATQVIETVWQRFNQLGGSLGARPILVLPFFAIGLGVLIVYRHTALAVSAIVLWIELFLLAIARKYPFLDQRTSYFLLVTFVVVASVGLFAVALLIARRYHGALPAIVVGSVVLLLIVGRPYIGRGPPSEDIRTQVRYISKRRAANDVVLVNFLDNWGFAYYWPTRVKRTYVRSPLVAAGYLTRIDHINAIFPGGRDQRSVCEAVQRAISERLALGGHGRIWIARSHLLSKDRMAWSDAFLALHVHPIPASGDQISSLRPLLVAGPTEPGGSRGRTNGSNTPCVPKSRSRRQ